MMRLPAARGNVGRVAGTGDVGRGRRGEAVKRPIPWRTVRLIVVILVALLALPYVIAPLYRVVDPVSTLMLWRWATGRRVERARMPIDRMASALPLAVITAEDGRFCNHHGIDFTGLREAMDDADDVSDMRGGSTITQQTVKNLFLWGGRSYVRKALELPLALWFDRVVPKRRQLEIYLNIAEWGPNGEFGAEAGARHAFGRSAAELNPAEAALMAAILPNPVARNAGNPSMALRRLAGIYRARATRSPWPAACVRRRRAPGSSVPPPAPERPPAPLSKY
jgi:monofunctional biosynthetic peptidoglycan transglycosylase